PDGEHRAKLDVVDGVDGHAIPLRSPALGSCGRRSRPSRRRAGKVTAARWADDLAVSRHELAGLDGRDRPAPQRLALERREIRHAAQVFGGHDFLEREIDDDEIGVGARRDRAFARKDAVSPRGGAGGQIYEPFERDAMAAAVMQQDWKMRAERRM